MIQYSPGHWIYARIPIESVPPPRICNKHGCGRPLDADGDTKCFRYTYTAVFQKIEPGESYPRLRPPVPEQYRHLRCFRPAPTIPDSEN